MLGLMPSSLFGAVKSYLENSQQVIDAEPQYADRVLKANASWDKKDAKKFAAVRGLLAELCSGARRCHYCEDSVADEVEHIWPKKFYPCKAFVWENYLFACGPCNGSNKSDRFAIFDAANVVVELERGRTEAPTAPIVGLPVFLDQRTEDPFDFIELDLTTGIFVPRANLIEIKFVRAEYTIEILGLNRRDYLTRARRNAYGGFLDSARQYVLRKTEGAPTAELRQRAKEISERHHQSVWAEMKRLATAPEHAQIFTAAPELLLI